ncbi:hypothetical protein [Streptomyces sp. AB3(2024)]|uniref:hypothetical protein n=1 Tax=Streptomyces sp. AB3(2024) TaxID=3317321 RepID=UPI0035A39823
MGFDEEWAQLRAAAAARAASLPAEPPKPAAAPASAAVRTDPRDVAREAAGARAAAGVRAAEFRGRVVLVPLDFPCGVALDAAGPDGAVFPPVRGIVPDAVALDGEVAV